MATNLEQDNAIVTDGLLARDGPGFSGFIIDNSTNITVEAVTRFLEYAEQGFPIIFVNTVPDTTPYYCPSCDEFVRASIPKLLRYPSVKTASSEAEVHSILLNDLKVVPTAQNLSPVPILYVHRWDELNGVDYFWTYNSDIYNDHETEVSIRVTSNRSTTRVIPYHLNAWTGEITAVLNYTVVNERFNLWVLLKSNQSTIFAFAPEGFFANVPVPPVHVVNTTVPYLHYSASGKKLIARTYLDSRGDALTLSDGRTFRFNKTSAHPRDIALGPWNLTVQDWEPNPDPTKNYTSVYTYHSYTALPSALVPWYNISGLEHTSGIGVYTSSFTWPVVATTKTNTTTTTTPEAAAAGAYLSLPRPIFHTVLVQINGKETPPIDVDDPVVDITPYLRNGTNAVRIEVASTLRNRLLVFNNTQSWEQSQYAGSYGPQPYGLVGTVKLVPFREVEIAV